MANLTPREQLMLELINRARMDPRGEAARLEVTLGKGQDEPVQVLAGNDVLRTAAYNHSAWMLLNDDFTSIEHKGSKSFIGATAIDRITAYGYGVSGKHSYGENISWVGKIGEAPDYTAAIIEQYEGLFAGYHSRGRMLKAAFQEAGIGQQAGNFTDGGDTYVASMVTQDFIRSGAKVFITGVIYSDTVVNNDFYDVGEAIAGARVSARGAHDDKTGAGGGYELKFGATGIATMKIRLDGPDLKLDVALGTTNVKVDVVNGNEIWTNASVQSQSAAIRELHALGVSPLLLIGGDGAEAITGNRAANQLLGLGGNDMLDGRGGKDGLLGGYGSDTLSGGSGADLFVYTARGDSLANAPDVITDFGVGADRLDLGALYGGRLKYRDESPITGAHQVNVTQSGGDVIVHINLDRDAADEMRIVLAGVDISQMSKGDFIL